MISEKNFRGLGIDEGTSGAFSATPFKRVVRTAPTSDATLTLMNSKHLQPGGPYWYLHNVGSATLTVEDVFSVLVGTVPAGSMGTICLVDPATQGWRLRVM